jgi:hypothetical protein
MFIDQVRWRYRLNTLNDDWSIDALFSNGGLSNAGGDDEMLPPLSPL